MFFKIIIILYFYKLPVSCVKHDIVIFKRFNMRAQNKCIKWLRKAV